MRQWIDISKQVLEEIRREVMPQIRQCDLKVAMRELKDSGVGVFYKSSPIGILQPTQENYSQEKVDSMKESMTEPFNIDPIIVANDGAIVDGHHRWLAAKQKFGPESYIPSYVIGLPIDKALNKYAELSKSVKR